jgi:hypothetical protein
MTVSTSNLLNVAHLGVTYVYGIRILWFQGARISVVEIRCRFDIVVVEGGECQRCASQGEPQRWTRTQDLLWKDTMLIAYTSRLLPNLI